MMKNKSTKNGRKTAEKNGEKICKNGENFGKIK